MLTQSTIEWAESLKNKAERVLDAIADLEGYKSVLGGASVLYLVTQDQVFVELSKSLVDLLGGDLRGKTAAYWMENVVHPEDRQPTMDYWAAALASGTSSVDFRNRIKTADGSYRTILWHSYVNPATQRGWAIGQLKD